MHVGTQGTFAEKTYLIAWKHTHVRVNMCAPETHTGTEHA